MRNLVTRILFVGWVLGASMQAQATQLTRFTPQGAVARITRVQADFTGAAVALGNDRAADPYTISCGEGAPKGSGRWVDPEHWVYTFDRPLAGAVSCQARPKPDFRDAQGQPVTGLQAYSFTTGGPRATLSYPWSDQIAEDQIFILRFNTDTDSQSLQDHSYCEVQGLGEKVPVRLITGTLREQILQSIGWADDPQRVANARLLQCKRLLPSGAQMRLVVGPGVQTPAAEGQEPVVSRAVLAKDFKVREAFKATMSCTRTHAQAPCSPLFPISVAFSAPIARALADRVVLQTAHGAVKAQELTDPRKSGASALSVLDFAPPFKEKATVTLQVPADLRDDMGRPLINGSRFPLAIQVDVMPPLVKFSSGPFGIIERFADGPADEPQTATVPLALRRVGSQLVTKELTISAGVVNDHVTTDDVQALQWFAKTQRLQEGRLTAGQWSDVLASRPMRAATENEPLIDVRSRSLFGAGDPARVLKLPGLQDVSGPDIEMVGVPVNRPGLHVIEIASPRLGSALLSTPEVVSDNTLYVRSAVLVTNLAVHVKTGRDDMLVWVTSLDSGKPVAGAQVAVLSCDGRRLREGRTDVHGLWHSMGAVPAEQSCEGTGQSGVFVTARIPAEHPDARGEADFSFAWSDWNQGIEPWRFDVPYRRSNTPDWVAHAVLDRTLLRTGETVSMKIFLRELTRDGVRNPETACAPPEVARCLPAKIQVVHEGSGDSVDVPVQWKLSPTGGVYALAQYAIPLAAHLGDYAVQLAAPSKAKRGSGDENDGADGRWTPPLQAGSFRVEAFKLPVLTGSLKISQDESASASPVSASSAAAPEAMPPTSIPAGSLVAPRAVRADLQLSWQSGGPARDLPATLSAVSNPKRVTFDDYSDYTFGVPDDMRGSRDQPTQEGLRHLILDKKPVRLDGRGGAQVLLADLPAVRTPQTWHFEASFADPNGEVQTLSQDASVWPASVVVGLQTGRWVSRHETTTVKLVVLNTRGQPQPNVAVQLDGQVRTTYSTRKRLIGGFYAYDSHDQVASLGTLCKGRTDARGELECPIKLAQDGEIQLSARASDAQNRESRAATSLWVWGGEAWFGGGADDRIDVIPSKASYRPGETAEFTVRMPFRHADALVAVEREGVLETHVVTLEGDEPVVRLPVQAGWGPNVYISVLAVRGRIHSVPWSSFFDWGWKHPIAWARARADQVVDAPAPTGLVDLAKPSYRFGLAQIQVHSEADRLKVQVKADRTGYQVRDHAAVDVQAFLPDGKPAARASAAFAAVDEALLNLMDNKSWNLLDAMRVLRDYGVSTATAQGEVVGRRHYGRKAVPAGGGGGFSATRELFDTLLLWQGELTLDEQGHARIQVPLNDSLTRFRLVAVVDDGQGLFGTGTTDIVSTQDLQVISGLPLMARQGDRYEASVTVRNRTTKDMTLALSAQFQGRSGTAQSLPVHPLKVAAGHSQIVRWPVTAPVVSSERDTLTWTFTAHTSDGASAADRIVVQQALEPAVPVTVRQATLLQIPPGVPQRVPVDASASALQDARGHLRGGIRVALQSSLAGTLSGVHQWLQAYPYACLEQLSSKAVGMLDEAAWTALMKRLPSYQVESGLVSYFPGGQGSVILTAQLIEVASRAKALGKSYALPAEARERMLAALQQYVFGRLDVPEWAPVEDRFWRKLIAVDALALAGAWQPGMLDSLAEDVSDWPTPAVVTWLSILDHVPDVPDRGALIAQTDAVVRARLARHGTTLVLSDSTADTGWWLMSNVATAQARLLMTVMSRPAWRADLPRLMTGLLALQSHGAWSTTTANVLGVLAVNQYARTMEAGAGQGMVTVGLSASAPPAGDVGPAETPATLPWAAMPESQGVHRQTLKFPWPASGRGTLSLAQQGTGGGWATVTASAAVPQTQPVDAGLRLERQVVAVSRTDPNHWSVGDVYRVRLTLHSQEPLVWSVISDPVPAGASILGGGLGRDSSIATAQESEDVPVWNRPSFIERKAGLYRAYFEVMDAGTQVLEYTVRINTPGDFQLPPTRAEALYQPDIFGSLPNADFHVEAQP